MSYVAYIEVNNKGEVVYINNTPFDPVTGMGKTMGELMRTGFLIDPIQEPEKKDEMEAIPMWDGTKVYFKYVEIIPTTEGEIIKLKEKAETQETALEELMFVIIPELMGGKS